MRLVAPEPPKTEVACSAAFMPLSASMSLNWAASSGVRPICLTSGPYIWSIIIRCCSRMNFRVSGSCIILEIILPKPPLLLVRLFGFGHRRRVGGAGAVTLRPRQAGGPGAAPPARRPGP